MNLNLDKTTSLKSHASMRGSSISILITIGSFNLFIFFGLIGFDVHHDGEMLAQAIAIWEGRTMHSEVYGHYGPLTPWTQSIFLNLPFSPGASLKIWAALQISLMAGLISDFWRVIPVKPWVTRLSAITWLAMSDVFIIGHLIPWSSIQGAFLVVASIYFLLLGIKLYECHPIWSRALIIASGMAVGVLPFSRINIGLSLWLVSTIMLIMILRKNTKTHLIFLRNFLLGVSMGALIPVVYMLVSKSFDAFLSQAVLGPILWSNDFLNVGFVDYLFEWVNPFVRFGLIPTLFFSVFFLLYAHKKFDTRRNRRILSKFFISQLCFLAVIYIIVIFPLTAGYFWDLFSGRLSFEELGYQLFRGRRNLLYLFAISHLFVGFYLALSAFKAYRRASWSPEAFAIFLVLGGSAAMFSQTYPLNDVSHMWWASAFSPLVVFWGLERLFRDYRNLLNSIVIFAVVVIAGGALNGLIVANVHKIAAPTESVAKGLWVRPETKTYLDDLLAVVPMDYRARNIMFITTDALPSVIRGEYLSKDKNYHWWSYLGPQEFPKSSEEIDLLVIQNRTVIEYFEFQDPVELIEEIGFTVLTCAGEFCSAQKK